MIYKEKIKIGLKDVWKGNKIGNKAILEYLENVAAYHSDSVGYGINTSEITGVSWILLNWKLEVIKRPEYGQVLEVHTWSRRIEKYYAYRDFEMYDEKNNLCAIATSKWLLINNITGKIQKVEPEMAEKYQSEVDKCVFKDEIKKIKVPEIFENSIIYETKRKDIDIIGHMHNLYYLDLAYEVLPEKVYNEKTFNNVSINYKKQIKLGDIVICKYTYENDKHIIVIENQDGVIHAIIELY